MASSTRRISRRWQHKRRVASAETHDYSVVTYVCHNTVTTTEGEHRTRLPFEHSQHNQSGGRTIGGNEPDIVNKGAIVAACAIQSDELEHVGASGVDCKGTRCDISVARGGRLEGT